MLSPLLSNTLFAAALHVVLVRFSKDEAIVRDLVQPNDDGVVGPEEQEPLACVRRAVRGMLHADDAGIVSKSAEGLVKIMAVIVTVSEEGGLTVSGEKMETMPLRTPDQTPLAPTTRHRSRRSEV